MAPARLAGAAAAAAAAVLVACSATVPGTDLGDGDPPAPSPLPGGGLGPTLVDVLDRDPAGYGFEHVRAFLVVQDGRPVFERYRDSTPETTHDVHSVTASIMSVLVGIAIEEGHLAGVHPTLGELLPDHAAQMPDGVSSVTLEHLLTMTGGLPAAPFDAGGPGDVVGGVLADGLRFAPGERFVHSDRGAHLVSAVLAEATGTSVLAFARERLFDPLEIVTEPAAEPVAVAGNQAAYDRAAFAWPVDAQGRHLGASHLKLTASDLVRIGRLMAEGGRREGRQLVPEWWVAASTNLQAEPAGSVRVTEGYGYLWWVTTADGRDAFAALGHGGQLVEVVPELELVVVALSAVPAQTSEVLDAAALLALVDEVVAPGLAP
ncbi:beta-lactamase family protein [Georgenia sp. EYE_87]|uniref:serine hydrolase domain-containing protein n=1 Tax=Georgenia sp. EYE_87 TaxID=2853448 RepID=UPI00200378B6|nr:serine hydrolase [Georgenia sp. EYE_87]MCK6209107.1 beta-lactamase family protein [Georgenia sp. EYE_87]